VFTIFVAAGAAGGAVLPYFVGLINQFAGRVAGMCSICIPIFGVLCCMYWMKDHVALTDSARVGVADTEPGQAGNPVEVRGSDKLHLR
jgi:nitrate/nitrite transporter NarK